MLLAQPGPCNAGYAMQATALGAAAFGFNALILSAGVATAAKVARWAPGRHRRRFGGGGSGSRRRAALGGSLAGRLFLGRPLRRSLRYLPSLAGRSGLLFGGPFLRFLPLRHDRPPDPLPIQNSCGLRRNWQLTRAVTPRI